MSLPALVPSGTLTIWPFRQSAATTILATVMLTACAHHQAPSGSLDRSEIDFGTVIAGQILHDRVYLVNSGDAPLALKNITAQCSCTAAVAGPDFPARSTQQRPIDVTLDTARLSEGPLARKILVATNDPVRPVAALLVKATILREIDTSAGHVDFGTTAIGQAVTKEVVISVRRAQASIEEVRTNSPMFAARAVISSDETRVVIVFSGDGPVGRQSGVLVIRTASSFNPEVRIPMIATVRAD